MKRIPLAILALSVLRAMPTAAQGSDLKLPDLTAEQRWERLASNTLWWQAALLEFGREHGMTAEEVGTWVGKFFSQGWLGGAEASQFLLSMSRNHMGWPGASVEVLSSSPTTVKARFNRPWDAVIGPDRQVAGLTGSEINAMSRAVDMAVAEWVGIDVGWDEGSSDDVLTLTTKYGPIRASNDLRWARGAYLSWLNYLELLELKMKSGKTAREVGLEEGKLYGPGWTAPTPWRLFRGMLWNAMGDPNTDCTVLDASPTEVRARCATSYTEQRVKQAQDYVHVTFEDVLESDRAFAESVAEQVGMRWEESWADGYRSIRVTVR